MDIKKYFLKFLGSLSFCFFMPILSYAANDSTIIFEVCDTNMSECKEVNNNIFSKNFVIGEVIPVQLSIKNPENAPIYSVQSWIKYNPTIFSITNLNDDLSDFPLAAPGEFKVQNDRGEIRIGRAVTGSAIEKNKIIIASFDLKILKNPNATTLLFYDYQSNDVGKTSVVTIGSNIPVNILDTKPEDLQFENLSSSAKVYSRPSNIPKNNNSENSNQNSQNSQNSETSNQNNISKDIENIEFIDISRPQKFRSRTYESGKTEHIWEQGEDERIIGYYLYYSTTSGRYMHRRDVGNTNVYSFPEDFFEKGRRIYFSVQAYGKDGKVSDFSDENYVVIGTKGSESHPFFEQIFPEAKSVKKDDKYNYYSNNENLTADQLNTRSMPTPKSNTTSGFNISLYFILLVGGVLMFFSGRFILQNE
jgi:hypothetical protein